MAQRNPQPGTDIRKLGRVDAPDLAGDLYRADEGMADRAQTVGRTAAAENAAIEGGVVRREKVHGADAGEDPGPQSDQVKP